MAWTYSDWITYSSGSASRLERLRLHVQEVANAIQGGAYSIPGLSFGPGGISAYLDSLKEDEQREAQAVEQATGVRVGFTRGRPVSW